MSLYLPGMLRRFDWADICMYPLVVTSVAMVLANSIDHLLGHPRQPIALRPATDQPSCFRMDSHAPTTGLPCTEFWRRSAGFGFGLGWLLRPVASLHHRLATALRFIRSFRDWADFPPADRPVNVLIFPSMIHVSS